MKHFSMLLGSANWAASGKASPIQVIRGNYLRRLIVYIVGELDLAAGAASGTPRSEAPAHIIEEIKIVGEGIGAIKEFDGTGLHLSTKMHNGVSFPVVVPTGGVAVDQVFKAVYTIDFILPFWHNIRPIDTILDTRLFTSLNVEIKFSANLRDALFTGNDRTESNPSATVHVFGEYEIPHGNFGDPMLYLQFKKVRDVSSAGAGYLFPLDVEMAYKNLIVSAQNKAVAGQYTGNDAIITNYSMIYNGNIYVMTDQNFVAKQYENCLDMGLTAIHAGANFLEFDKDGSLKEILNTGGGSSLELKATTTTPAGTNQIWVYPGVLAYWNPQSRRAICVPAKTVARPIPSNAVAMA